MSISRGMEKEDVAHAYNSILLSKENEQIMPFAATWMDLEIVTLSEVSQTERRIAYDIVYMWNLEEMVQVNLFTKQK